MRTLTQLTKRTKTELDDELFTNLFKANDKLGALIRALETGEKMSYLGITTKLSVFLKNALEEKSQQISQ